MAVFGLTRKAASLLWRNAGDLLRLTFPIFLLYAAISAVQLFGMTGELSVQSFGSDMTVDDTDSFGLAGTLRNFLAAVFLVLTGALMAVQVHRFVLREDRSLRHALAPGTYGAYVWRGFTLSLVGLAIFVVLVLIGILILRLAMTPGTGSDLALLLWFMPTTIVFSVLLVMFLVRLSLGLPGAAVGQPMGLGESFDLTRGYSLAIMIAVAAGSAVIELANVASAALLPNGALGWGVRTLLGWPMLLYNALVLTVLYGHRVEGRPLRD